MSKTRSKSWGRSATWRELDGAFIGRRPAFGNRVYEEIALDSLYCLVAVAWTGKITTLRRCLAKPSAAYVSRIAVLSGFPMSTRRGGVKICSFYSLDWDDFKCDPIACGSH